MFLCSGTASNLLLARYYYRFYRERTGLSARKAMFAGFTQLVLLFAFLVYHLKERDNITAFRQLSFLRVEGLFVPWDPFTLFVRVETVYLPFAHGPRQVRRSLPTLVCVSIRYSSKINDREWRSSWFWLSGKRHPQ
jgi:hypothetical protein